MKKGFVILPLLLCISFLAGFGIHYAITTSGTKIRENGLESTESHASPQEGNIDTEKIESETKVAEPVRFDGLKAYETVKMLCMEIGTRRAGTPAEKEAADRLERVLISYGCDRVFQQKVPLPDNSYSQNVIAMVEGRNPEYALAIGGHYDSRETTTGGNDNASGAATVVELARVFAGRKPYPTLIFVLFGAEEDWGEITPEHASSHFGSRSFVQNMENEMQRMVGMISLDMVGYGKALHIRYMGIGPMNLVNMLREHALRESFTVFLRQGGNLSDHEPFEKAGIPSAWLEYMLDASGSYDRAVHTPADDYRHVSPSNLQYVGDFMQSFIEGIGEGECLRLKQARTK